MPYFSKAFTAHLPARQASISQTSSPTSSYLTLSIARLGVLSLAMLAIGGMTAHADTDRLNSTSNMAAASASSVSQPIVVADNPAKPVRQQSSVTTLQNRSILTNDQNVDSVNRLPVPSESLWSQDDSSASTTLQQDSRNGDTDVLTSNPSVENMVDEQIADQTTNDVADGEVVESPSFADNAAIKSIENLGDKTRLTTSLSNYARQVNTAVWSPQMKKNTAMTVRLQTLLDWNHASPGPIDGGWGMNSKKALANFQAMSGIKPTGRMNQDTWRALTRRIDMNEPVLIEYTLTNADVNTTFANTPGTSEAKSKMKGLYYQNIKEMLAERFHMDVRYLEKLNKNKDFVAGETITVLNVGKPLDARINRVVANKADKTLYAYNGDKLVATYPTTVGSSNTPSPSGTFKIVNKVKMPWYKATVGENDNKKVYMLPPGPNNPVGVVWMGLSKPSYGIHGSPIPEGISRQASLGCIRLTNWDVLEVYANIDKGAVVDLQ